MPELIGLDSYRRECEACPEMNFLSANIQLTSGSIFLQDMEVEVFPLFFTLLCSLYAVSSFHICFSDFPRPDSGLLN